MTTQQKLVVIQVLNLRTPLRVHHGACEGADRDLWKLCRGHGLSTLAAPIPQTMWPSKQEQHDWAKSVQEEGDVVEDIREPLRRNGIIAGRSDALLAIPKRDREELRSGTWMTIRFARKALRPILIVWPDGRTSKENERAER